MNLTMSYAAHDHAVMLGSGIAEARAFGMWWLKALGFLGRNLGMIGACDRAFWLGWERGYAQGDTLKSTVEWGHDVAATWAPNVAGKAAP